MRPSYILIPLFPLTAVATVNGHCSGSSAGGTATGEYLEYGICIDQTTCTSTYKGSHINGGCPNDASNIKCCVVGLEGSSSVNPCGGISYCSWSNLQCSGSYKSGR